MQRGPAPRLDLLAYGDVEFVCAACTLSKGIANFRVLRRCPNTRRTVEGSAVCRACENASDLLVSRAIQLERSASELRIRAGQLLRETLALRLEAERAP